jgi:hypothetical protein
MRAHARAVEEGDLDRAKAIAWRLLSIGAIEMSILMHMTEHLFGSGEIEPAVRFARIISVMEPGRHRAYLVFLRAAEANQAAGFHRLGDWAFACDPLNPEGPGRAGGLAWRDGEIDAAVAHFSRFLTLVPDSARTWNSVGVLRREKGDVERAGRDLRRAACLAPDLASPRFAIAEEAAATYQHRVTAGQYRRVLIIEPGHHVAHQNYGHALRRHGHFELAALSLKRSVLIEPNHADAMVALGQLSLPGRDIVGVRRCFDRARVAEPDNAEAQYFSALTDLRDGRLEDGWKRYFWNLKLEFPRLGRKRRLPRWPDDVLDPTGILVWNDQFGIGEEIMYLGALDQLATKTGGVAISCTQKLEPLVRRSFPDVDVIAREPASAVDPDLGERPAEVPLIGAIASLRRTFDDFPAHRGYLVADPARVMDLRARYRGSGGRPLVGISWSSPRGFQRSRKSVPLAEWGPVFRALDARFISLQYHADPDEIAEAREMHGVDILVDPDLDIFEDLDAHAAQIGAMDRVISISSIAAHLAGALGKPVDMIYPSEIVLLWYWFHGRADSPWYPSMTIHRPPVDGDRAGLMKGLARYLGERTKAGEAPG